MDYDSERIKPIEDNNIIAADIIDGDLILRRFSGSFLNAGPVDGITQEQFDAQGPSGRVLDRATTTATLQFVTAAVDLGVSVDFTVVNRPVEVIGTVPYSGHTDAGAGVDIMITDEANVVDDDDKARAGLGGIAANQYGVIEVKEWFTVPGDYTRKLRGASAQGNGVTTGAFFNIFSIGRLQLVAYER